MSKNEADWMDTHSVTCLLCGGPADERETQSIRADVDEVNPALAKENPVVRETILALVATHGEGEAHGRCFDNAIAADRPSGKTAAEKATENYQYEPR